VAVRQAGADYPDWGRHWRFPDTEEVKRIMLPARTKNGFRKESKLRSKLKSKIVRGSWEWIL